MFVSRLRTSLTSSAGLCAPASSSLRRRLAAALPALISINNSANRSGPRPSRFFALRAVFAVTRFTRRDPLRQTRWRRRRASNSRSRSRRRVRDRPLHLFYRSGYGQKQQLVPKRDQRFTVRIQLSPPASLSLSGISRSVARKLYWRAQTGIRPWRDQ